MWPRESDLHPSSKTPGTPASNLRFLCPKMQAAELHGLFLVRGQVAFSPIDLLHETASVQISWIGCGKALQNLKRLVQAPVFHEIGGFDDRRVIGLDYFV